ncbi:MAG TPA: hypothetical protein VMO47_10340 [Rhodothermales bacterium]|nr:hypothetical protein [Rhodothermales bacterium]
MPQFELEDVKSAKGIERIRALTAEEAARQWLGTSDDAVVEFGKPNAAMEALEGWRTILVAGVVRGRIRPHQRMRFRRD